MAGDGKDGNGVARPSGATSRLLSERQVAERLNISEVTLQEWRCLQKGPPFIRLGSRMVRYRESDIEAWLVEQEVRPSRMVGPSPQGGGLGQYFERVERRTQIETSRAEPGVTRAGSGTQAHAGAFESRGNREGGS